MSGRKALQPVGSAQVEHRSRAMTDKRVASHLPVVDNFFWCDRHDLRLRDDHPLQVCGSVGIVRIEVAQFANADAIGPPVNVLKLWSSTIVEELFDVYRLHAAVPRVGLNRKAQLRAGAASARRSPAAAPCSAGAGGSAAVAKRAAELTRNSEPRVATVNREVADEILPHAADSCRAPGPQHHSPDSVPGTPRWPDRTNSCTR